MNLTKFVDRPVLSCVISVFIVVIGIVSLLGLPIEKYPDIAPPTIQISTAYPGASADAIMKSVIMPIEESVNGVEDMIYIQSSCTNSGQILISVYFKQGTNSDMAAVNVQNRVSKVMSLLPAEVTKIGVSAVKQQPSMLRVFAIYSPDGKYDHKFLGNFMHNTVKPAIQRINGVGNVNVFSDKYGMRIWLDPMKMHQYGLVPTDIAAVLGDQNIEAPLGTIGANSPASFQYSMKYTGRRVTEQEFANMVIKTLPDGGKLTIGDVAQVELGSEDYNWLTYVSGKAASGAVVYQTAGSNATQINDDITAYFKNELKLPAGVELLDIENGNEFLFAAVDNVVETLVIAIILVVLVVFFFLQDWRATLIPTISIFVSLIGTFAFLQVAGFTLNLLTLFSLVLVIGTVVDDSITVVEAVQERFDTGFTDPVKASKAGIQSLAGALITTTLVFGVVFIPVSFMGGTKGVFYRQFGLTMAVAVAISAINSMTLAPALAAMMLKPVDEEHEGAFMKWVRKIYRKSYNACFNAYIGKAAFFIDHKVIVFATVIVGCAALLYLVNNTKTGMVPEEDKGSIYIDITTPVGTSLAKTTETIKEVEKAIAQIPEIESIFTCAGQGLISGVGSNNGLAFVKLKPWGERKELMQSAAAVAFLKIPAAVKHIKGANVFAMTPPMIDGYGTGSTVDFWLQDERGVDIKQTAKVNEEFCKKLEERPEILSAYCSYNVNYPQYLVDVNAEVCQRRGVNPSEVLNTLGAYFGGAYASNFNRFSKIYRVTIQAHPSMTINDESLNNIYVRLNSGEMAPVSQFLNMKMVYDPMELKRFNLYNSISVNAAPAPGYSSGDAIKAINDEAAKSLPNGFKVDYSGMSREESQQGGGGLAVVLALCILFVYLVMAALYESVFIPFAVLLSVPMGLFGTFLFAQNPLWNMQNDIYLQVAVIMLIGLLAKTAILLTEYSTQCREAGMTLRQSALFAAKVRLRPVLMTVLTMIFGMLPMIVATGSGANGNITIGAAVTGGMIFGTASLLFFVPAMFVAFQTIQEKTRKLHYKHSDDALINEEIERLVKNGELTLPQELVNGSDNKEEE
ncbi:MAG: efflux RND transporter permease subunit [Muribaculaceae bacterium]|nr:efflux RND transporter permease subunit [Muribaculaceae bacterium]